ncbi:MAG: DnaJ domain-containing protein [Oscillatoria sp. PMC 1068.18]|nr:DnaJ domain-containing protein [Oscillatoria sp. PMC 1068.18]
MIATIEELLLALFLFGFCFCSASVALNGRSQPEPKIASRLKLTSTPEPYLRFTGESCHVSCGLEDAPESVLTGQFYQLARALMSPLACQLEDAPAKALKGQAYLLMSPLACQLEDAPATALTGQAYSLMSPLMSPLACQLEDAPATALTGQAYSLMSDLACQLEDAPATALTGQTYLLMSPLACSWEDAPATALTGQICSLTSAFADRFKDRATKVDSDPHQQTISGLNQSTKIPKVKIQNPQELEILLQENSAWWTVLGVKENANRLQVETAYKKLIRKWHPDLNRHPKATEATSRINVAYESYKLNYATQILKKKAIKKNYLYILVQVFRKLIIPEVSR